MHKSTLQIQRLSNVNMSSFFSFDSILRFLHRLGSTFIANEGYSLHRGGRHNYRKSPLANLPIVLETCESNDSGVGTFSRLQAGSLAVISRVSSRKVPISHWQSIVLQEERWVFSDSDVAAAHL